MTHEPSEQRTADDQGGAQPGPARLSRGPDRPGREGLEPDRLTSVEVDVTVRLAERRMSLANILDLGPGAMVVFPQRHDRPLELEIGGRTIGTGYAVESEHGLGFEIETCRPPASDRRGR